MFLEITSECSFPESLNTLLEMIADAEKERVNDSGC
jgi:hypothetical protein